MTDFVAWLRDEALVAPGVADFFERAAEVAASTPMFRGPDNRDSPWSLETLPALPPPKAMIEFVPDAPWNDFERDAEDNSFLAWREAIRPVALELEKALGEPVYYFADLQDDLDDDAVHRFLVLHWCCTHKPESAYVKYLLSVSGARDVEELKAVLIDPASYAHPFRMNDAFIGLEALFCRIDYLPPDRRKTVAVVFSTLVARRVAEALLPQKIGADVHVVAPPELVPDEWVKRATRYCRSWSVRYLRNRTLDDPVETLALVDELCVITDEETPQSGFDLKLPDAVEDLLWLALELRIEARYFDIDGASLWNPDTCLEQRGVPARVAARREHRASFTRRLAEIRLDNDYGSSGLWNERGQMLGYDLLDLPFPLVRRIATWQRDFDDTVTPPDKSDDAWWDRHAQEETEIARALQAAMGSDIAVKVCREGRWLPVDEFDLEAGGTK